MFLGTHIYQIPIPVRAAMLRADLQEEHSAAQRQDPAGEGAALVPVQDSDVVRDGDTYWPVTTSRVSIGNLSFIPNASAK